MPQFQTTELDFDQIKTNLKTYFKRSDSAFKDWDFEGSGLNNLLDVLAYNTHYNAITAHMAMNESFLDSAQVRSNVVSRARLLGYTPTSKTGPTASVNVTFDRAAGSDATTYTMARGTKFTTIIDGVTYTFQTIDDTTSAYDAISNTFGFSNVVIKQGVTKIQTFTINNSINQRFVINDKNIDTSTLIVKVFDSLTSTSYDIFRNFKSFTTLDSTSRVYYLSENTEGKYEVEFGNNTLGLQPYGSGKVEVEFLSSDGPLTNSANTFSYAETGQTAVNIVSVTTASPAAGGTNVEDTESIKFNAPRAFISQDRAVTSSDYKSLIKGNIPGIEDVIAWGGEREDPPVFGVSYIACKPSGALFLTELQRIQIQNYLSGKKMLSITPEIVDATYTYLSFTVNYRYNPSLTNLSQGELDSRITNTIESFGVRNLNNFNGIYRNSNLSAAIDQTDPSILNNSISTKARKNIIVSADTGDSHELNFAFELEGEIDQSKSFISSTSYTKNGVETFIEDEFITGNDTERNIYAYRTGGEGTGGGRQIRVTPSVGTVNIKTGKVLISNVVPDADQEIQITVTPKEKDVFTEKRNIIQIDLAASVITGVIDSSGGTPSGSIANVSTADGAPTYTPGY
jgi:hypothetical protein